MAARLFAAVVPPSDVVASLETFVEPRRDADLRWTDAETWHVTLAFYGAVPDDRFEDLIAGLGRVAGRRGPCQLRLAGAGAFPSVARAKVLWLGVEDPAEALPTLAQGARTAGTRVGIEVARERFVPHVTLARTRVPLDVTRWLRAVATYESRPWTATDVTLIESHLGQGPNGRPRYEVRDVFPLAG